MSEIAFGNSQISVGGTPAILKVDGGYFVKTASKFGAGVRAAVSDDCADIRGNTYPIETVSLAQQTMFDIQIPSWASRVDFTFFDVLVDTSAAMFVLFTDSATFVNTTTAQGSTTKLASTGVASVQWSSGLAGITNGAGLNQYSISGEFTFARNPDSPTLGVVSGILCNPTNMQRFVFSGSVETTGAVIACRVSTSSTSRRFLSGTVRAKFT